MTLHSGSGLQGGNANCFIHLDGDNRPVYMFGAVYRQAAAGRLATAPECISGFNTDGTPFAKGHIMAVELGGWDNSYNIVPQYENWQGLGGGAWRDMERAIGADGSIRTMIVKMSYDAPGDTRTANWFRFQGGDTLFHWEDKRIPSRFEVWTLTNADPGGYFSGTADFKLRQASTIIGSLGPAQYNHHITRMPDIDRTLWITRFVRGWVSDSYEAYKREFEEQKLARMVATAVSANTKGSTKPVKGIAKPTPTRSSTRTRSGLGPVPQPVKNADWFFIHKHALVGKILALPQAASWTPAEKATFDTTVLDRMVYG